MIQQYRLALVVDSVILMCPDCGTIEELEPRNDAIIECFACGCLFHESEANQHYLEPDCDDFLDLKDTLPSESAAWEWAVQLLEDAGDPRADMASRYADWARGHDD